MITLNLSEEDIKLILLGLKKDITVNAAEQCVLENLVAYIEYEAGGDNANR